MRDLWKPGASESGKFFLHARLVLRKRRHLRYFIYTAKKKKKDIQLGHIKEKPYRSVIRRGKIPAWIFERIVLKSGKGSLLQGRGTLDQSLALRWHSHKAIRRLDEPLMTPTELERAEWK